MNKRGFTLLETLVAITILLISIGGPLTIATKGLSSALLARDQITAFYLAQEAIEFARNERDERALNNEPWASGFLGTFSGCVDGGECMVDTINNVVRTCTGDCDKLLYDTATGFYVTAPTGSTETSIFRRSLSFETVNANEVAATVVMEWTTGLFSRTFTLRENILNWQAGAASNVILTAPPATTGTSSSGS